MLKIPITGQEPINLSLYYPQMEEYYIDAELKVKKWIIDNVKKDWVIFDCGANVGYHTVLFARMASKGKVYAFEPIIETFTMLKENIGCNKIKNVTLVNMALGNKTGRINETIWKIWMRELEEDDYYFITIDEFCKKYRIKRLDCIKIDTDGFDFEILQGAVKTIKKFNPCIILEMYEPTLEQRGHTLQGLMDWIHNMGYEPISIDNNNFILHLEGEK